MTSTSPPSTPDRPTGDGTPEPKAKKLDLSLSQTLGGALAAMTAATIGSRLGVAGTIVGAALASIVAGVGTTLYTASLRTTREKVQTVWSGRVAGTNTPAAVDVTTEQANTAEQAPTWEPAEAVTRHDAPRPRRELPWKRMVVGALAAFALAAVALTGFELLSGSALSGGQGTTIQQVTKEGKASKPTKADASDSASPTASPTASESPSAAEASESASEQPSASPTVGTSDAPSATPSSAATPTATSSASSTPAAEATPVR